jgi:hypothetical protein
MTGIRWTTGNLSGRTNWELLCYTLLQFLNFFWYLERRKLHLFIFRDGSYISLHCLFCLFIYKPTSTTQLEWIHNETIFPLFCIGLKLLFLTSRKENRLRVFERRLLRKILGPKEQETKDDCIKLRQEELYGFCFSLNIMSRLRIICILHIANVK